MDSKRLLERIESGNLKFDEDVDGVRVQVEVEAVDTLGMLLRRVSLVSPRRPKDVGAALRKQAAAVVERLAFLEELKVIEVDGMANAVQIRSAKPSNEGFTEVILRGGNSLTLQRHGSALHLSKPSFEKVIQGSDVSFT